MRRNLWQTNTRAYQAAGYALQPAVANYNGAVNTNWADELLRTGCIQDYNREPCRVVEKTASTSSPALLFGQRRAKSTGFSTRRGADQHRGDPQ